MSLPIPKYSSVEEYLAYERTAETRHEFLDGIIYEMAGESPEHSLICVNLAAEISLQLKRTPCAAYSSNMKICSGEKGIFSYADLLVVRGEPSFYDSKRDVITNPSVIFEVLSHSTEAFDRGDKFFRYRTYNKSLTDYVVISQSHSFIDHFFRQTDGKWSLLSVTDLAGSLQIPSINCELKLAEIYDRVSINPPPDLSLGSARNADNCPTNFSLSN